MGRFLRPVSLKTLCNKSFNVAPSLTIGALVKSPPSESKITTIYGVKEVVGRLSVKFQLAVPSGYGMANIWLNLSILSLSPMLCSLKSKTFSRLCAVAQSAPPSERLCLISLDEVEKPVRDLARRTRENRSPKVDFRWRRDC